MGTGGLLFITIRFEWHEVLYFVGDLLLRYGITALGFVFPLLAVVIWLRGRRRRALVVGLIGLACLTVSAGPAVWDGVQFRRAVRSLQQAEVTRVVPDLSGRTVAYVGSGSPDDRKLTCPAILRHSGASAVLLIEPYVTSADGRPSMDLTAPLDLTALVTVRAVIAAPAPDNAASLTEGGRDACAPVPLDQPPPRIDYFIMQGGYSDDVTPFLDVLQGPGLERFKAQLTWYFGPVDDPTRFQPSAANADLLQFRIGQTANGVPSGWPGERYVTWPPPGDTDPAVRAAVCRHGADGCRLN